MINSIKQKNNLETSIIFRANAATKAKAAAVKELMKVSSTSEVFRSLLEAKAAELGIS